MRALVDYADLKARIVPERLGVTLDLKRILGGVERGSGRISTRSIWKSKFMRGLEV
jgi:hypothetical protein